MNIMHLLGNFGLFARPASPSSSSASSSPLSSPFLSSSPTNTSTTRTKSSTAGQSAEPQVNPLQWPPRTDADVLDSDEDLSSQWADTESRRPYESDQTSDSGDEKVPLPFRVRELARNLGKPPEVKSYLSSKGGPINRLEFEAHDAWQEKYIAGLHRLMFEAIEAERKAKEETERAHELRRQAEDREIKLRRGLGASILALREGRRPPDFPELYDDSGLGRSEPSDSVGKLKKDELAEVTIRVILLRARTAVSNNDWSKAYSHAMDAFLRAERMNSKPLQGKASFWKGVAEYGRKEYQDAVDSFKQAESCRGIHDEGDWIDRYIAMAVEAMNLVTPMFNDSDAEPEDESSELSECSEERDGLGQKHQRRFST